MRVNLCVSVCEGIYECWVPCPYALCCGHSKKKKIMIPLRSVCCVVLERLSIKTFVMSKFSIEASWSGRYVCFLGCYPSSSCEVLNLSHYFLLPLLPPLQETKDVNFFLPSRWILCTIVSLPFFGRHFPVMPFCTSDVFFFFFLSSPVRLSNTVRVLFLLLAFLLCPGHLQVGSRLVRRGLFATLLVIGQSGGPDHGGS